MPATHRTMSLGAFLHPTGHHLASWRHPDAPRDAAFTFAHYAQMAQQAERGLFDLIFLADGLAVKPNPQWSDQYVAVFEPLTLLAALSQVTTHIGLVATASATYHEPYHVARKFASLDLLSGGRAGWNLVTSAFEREAHNFSRESHLEHDERYRRAHEFAAVVTGLWDSWEADAFIQDKTAGLYCDVAKLHPLNHRGQYFAVKGPLNTAHSPQGRPVIVQAGSSGPGIDLAAQTAEVVFTSQQNLPGAQKFYRALKDKLAQYGREPDSLKIMPGVSPIIGRTREEAQQKFEFMQSLILPELALSQLSDMLGGVDFSAADPDGPLPALPPSNAGQQFRQIVIDTAAREQLTLKQVALKMAASRSHGLIIGTADEVAEQLATWVIEQGCDGFNLMPPVLPVGLTEFVDEVVPRLQQRGVFRTRYEGQRLRDHLELAV